MIIYPAIDLRNGQCVRLQQGDPGEQTVYCDDPVALAHRWQAAGAEWLHMVNLDGAFAGELQVSNAPQHLPINLRRVRDIAAAVPIPIQFGGGIRTLHEVQMLLELGVSRVVLGTIAVRQPDLVSGAVERFGSERIAVGIDARNGLVATQGWQQTSKVTAIELGREMGQRGVRYAIYTDIARDGMLSGVNTSATTSLAMQTGLQVIASGGIASIEDIHALCQVESSGVVGAIIGKALYTGDVDLVQAIAVASLTHYA
jgi:phosphoribosylformimino-5-aminoimidazole carboxamide ribotide isomerase